MENKFTGVVRWFSDKLGYGFVAPDGADKDIFVHFSGISMEGYKSLKADERVSFVIESGRNGPQAEQVVRI